jgi:hypothetical protein
MRTLREADPCELTAADVVRVREAADDLIFAGERREPVVRAAFDAVADLIVDLLDRGGWSRDELDTLAFQIERCAPRFPLRDFVLADVAPTRLAA